ncbi:SLATT domain-containing protein [Actinoplanes sp. KI2]|uniref:SLATT domain-containing protein n=1 Tax=Actinoplanes sp. KI2 TaxID=2983315 RepID=UPI0021D5CF60|nr:SLATT domain-containing protein [Actinoplanes sp. KI2]MCU7729984.1 SLATT domain-containing protein [Actinoplanes sp. KI2]
MTHAQRQQLIEIDRRLSEEELGDRALVHAMVQLEWYRAQMSKTRRKYVLSESGALFLAGAATVLAALSAPAWITATVAAFVAFLAGLRRVVSWHDDWLAASEARAQAEAAISQYRLLPADERTLERQRELVAAIDKLVLDETRSWGRRRREKVQAELPG